MELYDKQVAMGIDPDPSMRLQADTNNHTKQVYTGPLTQLFDQSLVE